jgi:hypothetical protein
MPEAHIVANGAEDDAAIRALSDISRLLSDEDEWCIVGGHMTSLLSARFLSAGQVERRTGDADAGIPVELARSGAAHARLVEAGYVDQSGNRYTLPGPPPQPTIDLLVPAWEHRFVPEEIGGRAFDAMPGLPMALASNTELDVVATRLDRTEHTFRTRVPSVEAAIVLKANAWGLRMQSRDGVDLHNLFCILRAGHDIGSWRLGDETLSGARRDAAVHLHALADSWEARAPRLPFDPRLLVSSIRRSVTRP